MYLEHWRELAGEVPIFHSDFILVEQNYSSEWLEDIPGLYAVSLKDTDDVYVDVDFLLRNLDVVVASKVDFYITFTGKPTLRDVVVERYGEAILKDSFEIPIIDYKALQDDV
jgi:hypothetical protein